MAKEKTSETYQERTSRLFGAMDAPPTLDRTAPNGKRQASAGGEQQIPEARPSTPLAVGTFLLTGTDAVHGILNLPEITDPDRWLKRHGAPVAMNTGGMKRYLASDILRWAATKFGTSESGSRAMCSLADTLESISLKGGSTTS